MIAQPVPPERIAGPAVHLVFVKMVPGDEARGLVPFFQFRIETPDGADAGHINFRIGDTPHIRFAVGHIGFGIAPAHRGRGLAGHACRTLAPFIRSVYREVVLTCDPGNAASLATIRGLGAAFLDERPVPPDDPHHASGSRMKLRFAWRP